MNLTRTTVLKVNVGGWLVNRNSPSSSSGDIWESFCCFTPLSSPRKWSSGQWASVNGAKNSRISDDANGVPHHLGE